MKKIYSKPVIHVQEIETGDNIMESSIPMFTNEEDVITNSHDVLVNKQSVWGEEDE